MFGFFRRRTKGADAAPPWATSSLPESSDEATAIQACRELFGPPPRSLDAAATRLCQLDIAPNLSELLRAKNDPLLRIIADQSKLRDRGQVVWGQLVQANKMLFDPTNALTLPVNVVYSLDPYFDGRVGILERLAHGMYAQKGSASAGREMRDFVRVITNEVERIMRRELPRGYSGGRSVYFATCFIQPGHLPTNCLTQSSFPLLVNFEETESVMVLPSRYWPLDYVSRWRR